MAENEEIFSTPESEARLDLIRHLIENSELVPLVRGMSGIGKSLLASRLQVGAPDNWAVCHFSADSMMQPERLLAHIARCNGLPDAKEDNIRRLIDRFETMRKRGSVPVLLIDDAQELPPTSLITLLRLYERQVDGAPLVSLVLFANEQIDMLLSTPQLQVMSPQSIQVIDLPPLTREEADSYMRFLLNVEGLDPQLALDASRLDRLYRDTKGAPGALASAILEAVGEADGTLEPITGRIRKSWLWGAVPLGAVVLLLLLFQGPINRLFSPEVQKPNQRQVEVEESSPAVSMQPQNAEPKLAAVGEAERAAARKSPAPESSNEPTSIQVPVVETKRPVAAEAVSEPKSPVAEAVISEPVRPQTTPDLAAKETTAVSVPSQMPSDGNPSAAGESLKSVAGETGVVPATDSKEKAPEAGQDEPVTQAAEAAPAKEVSTPAARASSTLVKSKEWLREQAPGSYTVQLLAVENIESLQEVIEKYKLQEQVFSVRTVRKGRTWYPLLWGRYPNRAAALKAIKSLAAELQKGGAWARPLSSLQP
ncbi:MAG: SPOR domain-containing protein [Candidatus Thiodiazotropha sp.]